MLTDEVIEVRSPQEVAAEKALLLLMKNDPPGTRYRLDYQRLVMGRGEFVKVWVLHIL
jgi:hypothetical protein